MPFIALYTPYIDLKHKDNCMDLQQIKDALPTNVRRSIPVEIVNNIEAVLQDPDMGEHFRDNFISYAKVLEEGKFKIQSYIDAIKYVCYKMQDRTNFEAYSLTFPDRMQRFAQENKSNKEISAYVAMYHKSKLVMLIMGQAITPMWLLNRDNYQKAINTQVEIMQNSKSDLARTQAANSVLNHLKQPETHKVELDIGVKEDKSLLALKEQMSKFAEAQLQAIQSGTVTTKDVAGQRIIEGEANADD